jgi:hypothetical protein
MRRYTVTITASKATGGAPVRLPIKRTAREVLDLRDRYPSGIETDPPLVVTDGFGVAPTVLTVGGRDLYNEALTALARLYRVCEVRGDAELTGRAGEAILALNGGLKRDSE